MSFTGSEVLILTLPPLAVVLLITALVYAGSTRHNRRYRPGRPFEFTPVWFVAAPRRLTGDGNAPALQAAHAGEPVEGPLLTARTQGPQEVGGASDRW